MRQCQTNARNCQTQNGVGIATTTKLTAVARVAARIIAIAPAIVKLIGIALAAASAAATHACKPKHCTKYTEARTTARIVAALCSARETADCAAGRNGRNEFRVGRRRARRNKNQLATAKQHYGHNGGGRVRIAIAEQRR